MIKQSKFNNFIKTNLLFLLIILLLITFIFELYYTRQKSIELNDTGSKYNIGIIKILEKEIDRDEYTKDENSTLDELSFINYRSAESRYENLYNLCPKFHSYLNQSNNIFEYSLDLKDVLNDEITLDEMKKQNKKYITW